MKRLILSLALASTLAGSAFAAPAPKPFDPAQPSYVDIKKVLGAYRQTSGFARYAQKIQEKTQEFARELEALAQLRYCTPEERKEALELKARPKLSDAQQQRLDALMKKTDTLESELAGLAQKLNPTDAEKKRISELSMMRTEAVRALAREDADRRDAIRKLQEDSLEEVENVLLEHVGKLAKEKKIVFIYERRAVLVGGNDLTDEVIKRLPK